MPSVTNSPSLFPELTRENVLSFQFSSWYPRFRSLTIKSTIIRPLNPEFREYLDSEGVFLPEGCEDAPLESTLSDDEDDQKDKEHEEPNDEEDDDDDEPPRRKFAFPEVDRQIRETVSQYGAVFPKLNFSSPRDAAWMLPASSPMKCMSPSDVYTLLKASDFVLHDLEPKSVFDGIENSSLQVPYELELILRKWYPVDHGRELRCFVRRETLLGISQRDPNYYDFWNESSTQNQVLSAVQTFWSENIKDIFDILLTRDLQRAHIIDFNPYAPRTDPLLFTYEELLDLLSRPEVDKKPVLKVIDSRSHPAATRNAPAHQHNMVPIEALTLSSGRNVQEFTDILSQEILRSTTGRESDDDNDDDGQ